MNAVVLQIVMQNLFRHSLFCFAPNICSVDVASADLTGSSFDEKSGTEDHLLIGC